MYQVRFTKRALREIKKLDYNTQKRMMIWIRKNLVNCENPYMIPQYKVLKGRLGEYIRYRVGKYRIICMIYENVLCVEVISIGYRKEIYR